MRKLTENEKTGIFTALYIAIISIGGILSWQVMHPPPPRTPHTWDGIKMFAAICLSLGVAVGFALHGIHPLLLFKSDKSVSIKRGR